MKTRALWARRPDDLTAPSISLLHDRSARRRRRIRVDGRAFSGLRRSLIHSSATRSVKGTDARVVQLGMTDGRDCLRHAPSGSRAANLWREEGCARGSED